MDDPRPLIDIMADLMDDALLAEELSIFTTKTPDKQ